MPKLLLPHRASFLEGWCDTPGALLTPCSAPGASLLCVQLEGPQLMATGFSKAISQVGATKFYSDLFWVGMFYHLYNQVSGPMPSSVCLTPLSVLRVAINQRPNTWNSLRDWVPGSPFAGDLPGRQTVVLPQADQHVTLSLGPCILAGCLCDVLGVAWLLAVGCCGLAFSFLFFFFFCSWPPTPWSV